MAARLVMKQFAHGDELSAAVATAFAHAVRMAVASFGRASVVLTGGATPRAYLPALAALDLPWSRVTLTLSDERWVPPEHPDSNERLVRELLLVGPAAAATFVPLKNDAPDPKAGRVAAACALSALERPFDLLLLGLGADAHVASLFPKDPAYMQAITTGEPLIATTPPDGVQPGWQRLSMTLSALLHSRRIVVAATGNDKRNAFERSCVSTALPGLPLGLLARRARRPIDFLWAPGR